MKIKMQEGERKNKKGGDKRAEEQVAKSLQRYSRPRLPKTIQLGVLFVCCYGWRWMVKESLQASCCSLKLRNEDDAEKKKRHEKDLGEKGDCLFQTTQQALLLTLIHCCCAVFLSNG